MDKDTRVLYDAYHAEIAIEQRLKRESNAELIAEARRVMPSVAAIIYAEHWYHGYLYQLVPLALSETLDIDDSELMQAALNHRDTAYLANIIPCDDSYPWVLRKCPIDILPLDINTLPIKSTHKS